jgi:acyl-coenzyme A synthetase/AMP-(fatty) acid ligase
MTEGRDWLAASAAVHESGRRLDGRALAARAASLAPSIGGGLAVGPESAAAVAVAWLAANQAGVPLVLVRAAQDPADAAPYLLGPDLALHQGSGPALPGGFEIRMRTSGTTGEPKTVVRAPADLLRRVASGSPTRWLLTFEPTSFAGLQVLFTSLGTAGSTLVAAPTGSIRDLADLAVAEQVEAVSGTPTFWRALLVALGERKLQLRLVTLGGETADQIILDRLAARFPSARLRHIYATTETGAVFAVQDGRAGFPAAWLDEGIDGIRLRVVDGVLQVGRGAAWIDTGDLVTQDGDRICFLGRSDAMVKVAGAQVVPEDVERSLLAQPGVADVAVRARANPITGALLVADIVPDGSIAPDDLLAALRRHIATLPAPSQPRRLAIVAGVAASSGKKIRSVA